MSMNHQSTVIGRTILITMPATPDEPEVSALIEEIEIACPQCGTHTIRLAGHHLRAIRNLLIEAIDRHPDLCGSDSGIAVVNRMEFGGTPPRDPNSN